MLRSCGMEPTTKRTTTGTFWICSHKGRYAQVPDPIDGMYPEVYYRHLLAVLDELGIKPLQ